MPVDNRNFIIEDIPGDDPEDDSFIPEDEEDEEFPKTTWTPPRAPWQQPFQPPTVYPPQTTNPWYHPVTTPSPQVNLGYQQRPGERIDRRKKIIFCDLYDILIESESAVRNQPSTQGYLTGANNYKRTGIIPRGLYDIRLKTEVWSKLAAFGADYIFCVTNQPEKSAEEQKTWRVTTDFVMYALADYLNLPHDNCRCFTKLGFSRESDDTKPGVGLLKRALSTIPGYKYTRRDLVVIGVNSGYQNQSNIDKLMAKKAGIDYVDVGDLLVSYV